jgi:hypothetical protein
MRRVLLLALWWASLPARAGELRGVVRYAGSLRPAPSPVTKDAKVCGQSQPDESLQVSASGGLHGAVVSLVEAPLDAPAGPSRELTLDQQECRYRPHILAARVNDTLLALNSDSLLHNVRGTRPDGRTPFNVAMPLRGMRRAFALTEPGLIQVGCDAGHTWMTAYVHVFPHPFFAVTDEEGRFALPALRAGSYALRIWHERLGETTRRVQLTQKGADVKIELR